jgi:hypothetical protein
VLTGDPWKFAGKETRSAESRLKWLGEKCFFVAIFKTPDASTFEHKFARLQHVGGARFNLAFVRPNGQWFDMPYQNQTLDECLKAIVEDPWFQLA